MMTKKLDSNLTLYFTYNFPFKSSKISKKKYTATIGVGGNITNVILRFKKLFNILKTNSKFTILKTSPILKNPPFGYMNQDDFFNAIIVLQTDLSHFGLLRSLQRYEYRFKRKRTFKDAPRTLDLDIIFFHQGKKSIQIDHKDLIIPHKEYKNRNSVMIPLNYL